MSSIKKKGESSTSSGQSSKEPKGALVQQAAPLLYIAAFSALLGGMGMGVVIGWAAPATANMGNATHCNTTQSPPMICVKPTKDAQSWIGSSMTLGGLFGALISGPAGQMLGRKKALILYGIPFTIGWVLLVFTENIVVIILARVILGLSVGMASGSAPNYVVEVAITSIRGTFGACFQLAVTIGILLAFVIGAYVNFHILSAILAIPTIAMSVLMVFMPESPTWLVMKDRIPEAEEALKMLRDPSSDIKGELAQLQEQAKADKQGEPFSLSSYFGSRQHGGTLALALGLQFFQQFSGINIVMFYATDLFDDAQTGIPSKYCTMIVGATQVPFTIVATVLVDRLGRKILLIASAALHALSLGAFGCFYIFNIGQNSAVKWLPILFLVVFIIGFSIGHGPVPMLMTNEMAPSASRSATCAIAIGFNWTCAFIITKEALSKGGTYMMFALYCVLSIPFVMLTLPETKGRSTEELQNYFLPKGAAGKKS